MSSRMRINKDSIEAAILVAALGQVSIFAPIGGAVVLALTKHFVKKWWEEGGPYIPPETDPEQVRESIYKLKRNDYIQWRINKKANKTVVELTKKGQKAFAHATFANITIDRKGDWDGQWRFFLFDIPEKRRKMRDILRARVKSLGFFQFQKSVWIYPFECEKEIRYVCEYLEATPYTMLFTAKIDNDRILRRYFLRERVLLRRHLNLVDKGLRY
ncbi:MAG: hypothetical protein WAP23_03505 [Candidatus Spechtbacterales bacterium]